MIQLGTNPAKAAADFEQALIANSTSLDAEEYATYPDSIEVREVRVRVETP